MTPPDRRVAALPRLLQAAVFAAACVLLSAAGHALTGGRGVPLWALVVGGVGVLAAVAPLTGRERTLPAIAVGLAAGQLGLHLLFAGAAAPLGQGVTDGSPALHTAPPAPHALHGGGPSPATAPEHAGHAGELADATAGPLAGAADCVRHLVRVGLSACDLPMLLAHLLAALATGWLLRRGQVALWRVLRLSTHTAERLAARAAPRATLRTALWCALALAAGRWPTGRAWTAPPWDGAGPHGLPRPAELRYAVVRRGPPPAAVCAPAA